MDPLGGDGERQVGAADEVGALAAVGDAGDVGEDAQACRPLGLVEVLAAYERDDAADEQPGIGEVGGQFSGRYRAGQHVRVFQECFEQV
ncbi:hypothetical protein EEZ25_26205 [Micromonospora aurantiaca]|nr:hypothetical protein EEZ25_26205 [Micromonospora aurantiaca]